MASPYIQLPLPLFQPEGLRAFRLNTPIYQDGKRYTHRFRWFLAEMSVAGLHREEVARAIGEALRDKEPYKYSRTRFRGQANLIIYVSAGAYGNVLHGTDKLAAIITPAHIPKLHEKIINTFAEHEEAPGLDG